MDLDIPPALPYDPDSFLDLHDHDHDDDVRCHVPGDSVVLVAVVEIFE